MRHKMDGSCPGCDDCAAPDICPGCGAKYRHVFGGVAATHAPSCSLPLLRAVEMRQSQSEDEPQTVSGMGSELADALAMLETTIRKRDAAQESVERHVATIADLRGQVGRLANSLAETMYDTGVEL